MIAHIYGKIVEKFNKSVIVDVHGIGYEVNLVSSDFDRFNLDSEVKLYTYHHIREQSQELFGFSSLATKKIFELLITVQGVGPKAAMAILGVAEPELVRNAIANSDTVLIAKASGVGKKTAERVIVDLKDKVGLALPYEKTSQTSLVPESDEALEALMALGYSLNDAMKALESIPTSISTSERVKMALKG